MKKIILSLLLLFSITTIKAQNAYDIKINLKHCKDTLAYLTFYQFDKNMIADTCTAIKNGQIEFKGKKKLSKGIYSLVGQGKTIYFDFFVDDENQNIAISSESVTNYKELLQCSNSKIQNDFFDYIKYFEIQRVEFESYLPKTKGLTKKDSTDFMSVKQKAINENIENYEKAFILKNKGTFISDALNLKIEKYLSDIPKAKNGRPDSIAVYDYYKKHYWDGVDFKDDGLARTPFFHGRLNRYFDSVIIRDPDSVSVEIDRIMHQAVEGSIMYKLLLANFTNKYETIKIMGFDKVFVSIVDHYFKTGKAKDIYNDDNIVNNIINRANVLRPLLLDEIAPELPMIPIESHDKIAKMGFENAKTSEELTKIFYANAPEIEKTFLKLRSVKAKYTLLVFWDVDCSHCQVEIPKLIDLYHQLLKDKIDVKVFCVYTQHEFVKYKKYVEEKKLDWINVYDGVHYNNLKDKYDIYSTPVIYILDKDKKIKAKRIDVDQIKLILTALDKVKN
jgi:hypothetical protein